MSLSHNSYHPGVILRRMAQHSSHVSVRRAREHMGDPSTQQIKLLRVVHIKTILSEKANSSSSSSQTYISHSRRFRQPKGARKEKIVLQVPLEYKCLHNSGKFFSHLLDYSSDHIIILHSLNLPPLKSHSRANVAEFFKMRRKSSAQRNESLCRLQFF